MREGMLGPIAALLTGAALTLVEVPGAHAEPDPAPPAPAPARPNAVVGVLARLFERTDPPASPAPGPMLPAEVPPPPAAPVPPSLDPLAPPPAHGPGADCPCVPLVDVPFRDYRWWFRGEYLIWGTRPNPLPVPLVTLGTTTNPGIIGQPGTLIALGDRDVETGVRQGGRFTVGTWLGCKQDFGLEATYLSLASRTASEGVASSGLPGSAVLGIPFFDVTIPGPSATFLADPGRFSGTATAAFSNRVQGAELHVVYDLASSMGIHIDLLFGFRYLEIVEGLAFTTSSPNAPPGPADVFNTFDQFDTTNRFYGPQLGVRAEWLLHNNVLLGITGKWALGPMNENVAINGALVTNDFNGLGVPQVFPGGYYAQPTNIGRYHRERFASVPELDLLAGYQFSERARVFLGYTLLYASDVARPGNQIEPWINPTQSPAITGAGASPATFRGQPVPTFNLHVADFWAQGLNLGFEVRY